MSALTATALFFLLGWIALINLPWVLPSRLLSPGWKPRLIAWALTLPLLLLIGWLCDRHFAVKPHAAYAGGDFWATFIVLSVLFAVPGGLYWFHYRRLGA